jgi:hypothetical protein
MTRKNGLAMTDKCGLATTALCRHCEERSDAAISHDLIATAARKSSAEIATPLRGSR